MRGQRALPRHLPRPRVKVQLGRRSRQRRELEKAEVSRALCWGLLSAVVPGDGDRPSPLSERLAPKDSGLTAAASRRAQKMGSTELSSLEGERGGIFFLLQ